MKKKKKSISAMPDKPISPKLLEEIRKEEMAHCLPGMRTQVNDIWVDSPNPFERTLFSIGN